MPDFHNGQMIKIDEDCLRIEATSSFHDAYNSMGYALYYKKVNVYGYAQVMVITSCGAKVFNMFRERYMFPINENSFEDMSLEIRVEKFLKFRQPYAEEYFKALRFNF